MTWNNEMIFTAVLEQLAAGQRVRLSGTGTSMEPTIHTDTDQLELAAPMELQVGQICLYIRPQGGYAIHRIHKITPKGIVLVGDNQVKTETVCQNAVLAQVVAIHRASTTIDATTAAFLTAGYRANRQRLRRFHLQQLRYNLINFPRRIGKKLLKK